MFVVSSLVGGVAVSAAGVPGGLSNRTVSVGSTYTILGQTGTLHPGGVAGDRPRHVERPLGRRPLPGAGADLDLG